MTVLIGYLDMGGVAHLATDGMASGGYYIADGSINKIAKTKDENLMFGITGNPQLLELKYYSYLPDAKYIENDNGGYDKELPEVDDEYFYTKLRYKIREKLVKMAFDDEDDAKSFGNIILMHEDKLYQLFGNGCDLYKIEKGNYATNGCGTYSANGAMDSIFSMNPNLSIKEKMVKAVKVVSKNTPGVGRNVYYANTKDYQVEEIEVD